MCLNQSVLKCLSNFILSKDLHGYIVYLEHLIVDLANLKAPYPINPCNQI